MKRLFLIALSVILLSTGINAQQTGLPSVQDTVFQRQEYKLDGQWLPDVDSAKIGAENFKTLQNMRYIAGGIEGVQGYTKFNSTSLPTNYTKIRNGFQLRSNHTIESYILAHVEHVSPAANKSKIYYNTGTIPDQNDFVATALHTDTAYTVTGRFSPGPGNNVLYANGEESMIWAGNEKSISAFITSTAAVTDSVTGAKDYTDEVINTLSTAAEVVVIGGGNDADTVLLMHFDEAGGGTTFDDSSVSAHNPAGGGGNEQVDSDQKKFGIGSLLLDGTGDFITVGDHIDWSFATGDFAVDLWVRFSSLTGAITFVNHFQNAANEWFVQKGGDPDNKLTMRFITGGAEVGNYAMTSAWAGVATDTWYHLAFVRSGASGLIFIDGVSQTVTETTAFADVGNVAGSLYIGRRGGGSNEYTGWMDEIRISKGVARWTSDFTPSPKAYSADSLIWLVGSTRPLKGVKFYVEDANIQTSTYTVKEFTGASWTVLSHVDGISSGGIALAQTGTVAFSSTVNSSRVKYLEDLLLYWYQFELSDGEATISFVTVDADFQPIVDIWDGVFRTPIQFQLSTGADYTLEVNEQSSSVGSFVAVLDAFANSDDLFVMFDDRITAVDWRVFSARTNTTANSVTISYWDGATYTSVGTVSDGTALSGKSLGQSGVMSWNAPSAEEEFPRALYGVFGHVYKIEWNVTLDAEVEVDTVWGVPAQLDVMPFKFPSQFKNRALLAGYTKGKQGNRVDYSLSNAADVWNGEESSMDGIQSLYFGNEEDLTAGTQLYNRFGSNIFATWIAFKDGETYLLVGDGPESYRIFPISYNIGCPAPLTLATAEMGYQLSKEIVRNVAIWLSYSGPMLFDGAVMVPIRGIEKYFDPADSDYISRANIERARGWFDTTYDEYNLLISTGSSTDNDTWLVYDLKRQRWYEKVPATYPQSAWQVMDTAGFRCVYAGLDDGFVVRLEESTTWNGTAIDYVWETGDFFPTGSMWDQTTMRYLKLISEVIAEDADIAVTHYTDTAATGSPLSVHALDSGANRINRTTQAMNGTGWTHRFKFSVSMGDGAGAVEKALIPLGWGYQFYVEREDLP